MNAERTNPMRIDRAARRQPRAAGFTLLEILVVVSIIIILAAILIGALGTAKTKGYSVKTQAELAALSNACDQYYQFFQAYPGPLAESALTLSSSPISGSQNLGLGLLGTLSTTPPATTTPPTPYASLSTSPAVDGLFTINAGPIDLGTSRQYAAMFAPSVKNYVTLVPPSASATTFTIYNLEVLVDAYPDGMPILYYRRTPGVDGTLANKSYVAAKDASGNPAAYYWGTNVCYTGYVGGASVTVTSSSGNTYPQTGWLGENDNFASVVQPNYVSASPNEFPAQGGFVLMSAGPDHIYGNSLANGTGKYDDIVVFGGQ